MKTIREKFIKRINELLEKAKKVKEIRGLWVDIAAFYEWKSNAENLIISIAGDESIYYQNFVSTVKTYHPNHVNAGIGILRALREDLEKGFLTSVKDLVISEVFTNFLDMAKDLLDNGYKDPAALLIGAVLEDGLRKIADKNKIPIKQDDDISSLNTRLADKGIYNRTVQKQIQVWKDIRNNAAHGKFNEYDSDQVRSMLEGVIKFLAEYL